MAGFATDSWTQTFTVTWVGPDGPHTVAVTAEGDGVNEPDVSATVDGRPAQVTVALRLLEDGLTPLDRIACPATGCTYLAVDGDDLVEHHALDHPKTRRA
jgi:hypothetical protein